MNLKWPSKPLGRVPRHQTNIDTALVDLCIGPYTYKTQGSNLSPLFGGLFLLKTDFKMKTPKKYDTSCTGLGELGFQVQPNNDKCPENII